MKTALVTGASRGIGRAIAQRLAIDSYRVIAQYNTGKDEMRETLSGMPNHHPHIQADLSDQDQLNHFIKLAEAECDNGLDLLVHNAGIYQPTPIAGPDRLDPETWRERWQTMLRVNFWSGVDLAYQLMPALMANGGGKIIQITSRAGIRGEAGYSAYAASKAAQANFVRSLATELAPMNVYAYGIAPGWTETTMSAETFAQRGDAIAAEIPFGRPAQPEEIASLVAFLCTEGANYLTGNVIDVNGASYLH